MLILNKNDIIQHVDLNKNLIPIIEEAFNKFIKGIGNDATYNEN